MIPLKMLNAIALGFHNAPRLYGDQSVRPSPQGIVGFRSGVKVAGQEFFLGFYDGITGVVMLPVHEVHEEGFRGLPKGVARGLGGLVLKPIAGGLGVGAYTAKGIHTSIRRHFRDTEKTERWIRRARIAQGQKDVQEVKEQSKKSTGKQGQDRFKDIKDVRDHALVHWTTHERHKVIEAREKERRSTLFKSPSRFKSAKPLVQQTR
jgi:hypothetical protein